MLARYKSVSNVVFQDEDGQPCQFTWRTIQTWWYYYRRHGVTAPKSRTDKDTSRKSAPQELLHAIEHVRPYFSGKRMNISEVYRKCIELGLLDRSQIAPNTFRRHVKRFDLLTPENETKNKIRKAFAKANANDLWQCDTMVGPYIRVNAKPAKVYLICFIDDASRVVPHGQFYLNDNTSNLIDCFQHGIFKRGVPRAIYVDNGSNYASKEMSLACCRIGTVLIHTPVRDGAAKGKIERFFRTVRDQFLIRNLKDITLQELNDSFRDWVEQTYHIRRHDTLDMKPIDRFGMDLNRVQWLQPSIYNQEIFFAEKTRKVRADNTFQYNSVRYEAPRQLPKQTITIRYDRYNTNQPPIVYLNDERLGEATPLDLIDNDRRPNLSQDYD